MRGSAPRALLLDLDNTLIDRDAAFLAWLGSLCARGATLDVDRLVSLDRGGHGNKRALFLTLGAALGIPATDARALHDRDLPAFVTLAPAVAAWLDAFDGPKVIVSNGSSALQRAKVEAAGLEPRVDGILISGEQRTRKPHAGIFQRALALAKVRPDAALMVGDHPVADIGGATAAGIPACMLRTRWFPVPHGVRAVEQLREVFA